MSRNPPRSRVSQNEATAQGRSNKAGVYCHQRGHPVGEGTHVAAPEPSALPTSATGWLSVRLRCSLIGSWPFCNVLFSKKNTLVSKRPVFCCPVFLQNVLWFQLTWDSSLSHPYPAYLALLLTPFKATRVGPTSPGGSLTPRAGCPAAGVSAPPAVSACPAPAEGRSEGDAHLCASRAQLWACAQ